MAIISKKYNFIFIKTTKTAGTSLEVHLARRCGGDDVVTEIFPAVEGHTARNWITKCGKSFYNHMPAEEIRAVIGSDFQKMFRFCFERHPVHKCLSHFAMLLNSPFHKSGDNPVTWHDYLDRGTFPIDVDKYCAKDGTLLVDRVYRYERINEALREIQGETGLPYSPLEVHAKSGFRYGVPTYEAVMADPAAKARIFGAFETTLRFALY